MSAMTEQIRKNFSRAELECPCCGICHISERALDRLQALRERVGKPLRINSAARCPAHNAAVGGAPHSHHLSTPERAARAFDIALRGHNRERLVASARAVGFRGLGLSYRTFVHVDDRDSHAEW